ncbi:hypothetical protein B4110_0325 [Parageobacillus toebii]|uniref:Uncharacterized protein n=1 Tax=Parageobacillus toebii TaxID=153151 RepID=A0A150N713_9BACL|nr:hypothetical protein B4110_0325 [Parageobacillus toebii]
MKLFCTKEKSRHIFRFYLTYEELKPSKRKIIFLQHLMFLSYL